MSTAVAKKQNTEVSRDSKKEDREAETAARDDDVGFKEAREAKKGEKSK